MKCIHCNHDTNMHQRSDLTCFDCGKPVNYSIEIIGMFDGEIELRRNDCSPMYYFDRCTHLTIDNKHIYLSKNKELYTIGA